MKFALKNGLILAVVSLFLAACAPEGSERWCVKMKEKSKAHWTAHEAKVYAENCIFDQDDDA